MTKRTGDVFASVRERGLLNSMLDTPAEAFERANPGMKAKWEYSPPSGDRTMVTMREAQGYKLADASQLADKTDSSQKSGEVRRGDLVLMYAPTEVHTAIALADHKAAQDDYRAPERTYKEHLESQQYQLSTGEVRRGRPFGEIKRTVEEASIPTGKGGETE